VLLHEAPQLGFRISAYDLEPELVVRARLGRYTMKEVHDNPRADAAFIDRTFTAQPDGSFLVRPELAARVQFGVADLLDPALVPHVGMGDVVFAQNLLYHLRPADATRAFAHLVGLLRRPGALFVDGMDLDLRERLTRRHDLRPLDWHISEIHEQARAGRGDAYPWRYYGLEPLRPELRDWRRRYATIFLRD
jgi:chemotaxis protein methyltransferase CheR